MNKFNFHMMLKQGKSVSDLRDILVSIDDVGYKSILLTFSSDDSDYIVKAARACPSDQKTRLMFALRPYVMSSRFCAMVSKSFDEIIDGGIMFNIVAGTSDRDADRFIDGTSIEDRRSMAGKFIEKLKIECIHLNTNPSIYVSGSSRETIKNASNSNGIIVLLDDYIKNKSEMDLLETDKIIRVFLILDETEADAKIKFDALPSGRGKDNCIYGNEESILKKLSELGQTDILISGIPYEYDNDRLNEFVKKYSIDKH